MDDGIGSSFPRGREKIVAVIVPVGAKEKEHGSHKGGVEDPRCRDHFFGFFSGHLEAQGIDDGVEPVYADGEENIDLDAWGEILEIPHDLAHHAAERPPASGELKQDERRASHADEKIRTCHGDHKVVGGGLSPPTSVDDQTNQGIAKDRKQPQGPKENAGCGHLAGLQPRLQVCSVAHPAVLLMEFRQVMAR